MTEKLSDVSGIAFGSVRDKDRICIHIYTISFIISGDGISGLGISLFRAVTFESRCLSHLINTFMKSFDGAFAQWTGNITDTQTDYRFVRMFLGIGCCTVCDL